MKFNNGDVVRVHGHMALFIRALPKERAEVLYDGMRREVDADIIQSEDEQSRAELFGLILAVGSGAGIMGLFWFLTELLWG